MTDGSATLVAEFPRAVSGYARPAVDDFVRQIGGRLESLQTQLESQSTEVARLTHALSKAQADLTGFAEKEKALGEAVVMIEHRRAAIIKELADQRVEADAQVEAILDEAREQSKKVVEAARAQGAGILKEATAETDRARGEAARIVEAARKGSEEMLEAALTAGDEARTAADKILDQAKLDAGTMVERAKADAERSRAEAGEIVASARSAAEEARSRQNAAEGEYGHIRGECSRYIDLMTSIRASLETQIAALGAVENGVAVESRMPIAA